jgi:hypothetical protein
MRTFAMAQSKTDSDQLETVGRQVEGSYLALAPGIRLDVR